MSWKVFLSQFHVNCPTVIIYMSNNFRDSTVARAKNSLQVKNVFNFHTCSLPVGIMQPLNRIGISVFPVVTEPIENLD